MASAKGQQRQRSPVKPRDCAASQGCASSRVTGFVAGPCVTPVSDNTSAGGTFPQKGLCEGNCESCNPNGVSAFSAGIGKHHGVTKLRFLGGLSFNHSINYSCQKLFPLPAVSAPSWDSPSHHAASLRTRKTEPGTYQLHQQAVGDLGVVFLNLLLDLLDGRRFGFFFLYCWCYILESEGSGFSWVRGRRSAPLSMGNRGDEGAAQTLSSHQQRRHRRRRSRG